MKLLEIKPRRKGLSELLFDCELNPAEFGAAEGPTGLIALDSEVLLINGVTENAEISTEKLKELVFKSNLKRAKDKALWYLSCCDHTKKELFTKLRKSFGEEASSVAVSRMTELGLLDDFRFAKRFFESCLFDGKRSIREIEYKLSLKGVDKDIIKEVKAEILENTDYSAIDTLVEIINKKYLSKLNGDRKETEKVFAALLRKGFNSSDIKAAFSKIINDIDYIYSEE